MPDHFIALKDAKPLIGTYRELKEEILADRYKAQGVLPVCETYDRAAFEFILGLPDCQKVRIYYGMDASNQVKAIVVGVDSKNQDILPADPSAEADSGIIDKADRCPDFCPPASELNS